MTEQVLLDIRFSCGGREDSPADGGGDARPAAQTRVQYTDDSIERRAAGDARRRAREAQPSAGRLSPINSNPRPDDILRR
jgi:hypothetical protein